MQRIEIARIAATVQGVNADNFFKFCESLEGWVKNPGQIEADDPQIIWDPDKSMLMIKRKKNEDKKDVEIDWSRQQLVIANTIPDIIVKTSGEHDGEDFWGHMVALKELVGKPYDTIWKKSWFKYYGEIAEELEQKDVSEHLKNPGQIEEVKPEIDWLRPQLLICNPEKLIVETTGSVGHDHRGDVFEGYAYSPKKGRISDLNWFGKSVFAYYGEIPNQSTGLTFTEAIKQMKPGDKIRREKARTWVLTMNDDGTLTDSYADTPVHYIHYLSDDWEIIEK